MTKPCRGRKPAATAVKQGSFMILYDLQCAKGHRFEAWFKDGAAYDDLSGKRKLACPLCGDRKVDKAVMAPRIGKSRSTQADQPVAMPNKAVMGEHLKALRELRRKIEDSCDYVGDDFAEEARKIHYGETDPRGIYGETSREEAEALDEEGIEYARVPWVPSENS